MPGLGGIAVGIRELSASLTDDGRNALIKVVRADPTPSGETEFHMTVPMPALASVINVMLQLMQPAGEDGPSGGRGCFEAAAVELDALPDGRPTVSFQLTMGGRLSFVMDDRQTRIVADGLSDWLARRGGSSLAETRH